MSHQSEIYVYLLDEGVDVWRPVSAEHLGDDRYRILGTVPDGENWQFAPGAVVRCRTRRMSDLTEVLVAFAESN